MITIITSMTVTYHRIHGNRTPQTLTRVFDAGLEPHCFNQMMNTIEGTNRDNPSIVLSVKVVAMTEKDVTNYLVKRVTNKPKHGTQQLPLVKRSYGACFAE